MNRINGFGYINLLLMTSNQWLANGFFNICIKISSCKNHERVGVKTHHVMCMSDLVNRISSISGRVVVVFDSADYFLPKICSVINQLTQCTDQFKFIFLCQKNEIGLFNGVYDIYFDAMVDKKSSTRIIEATLYNVLKRNTKKSLLNLSKANNDLNNSNPTFKLTSREHMIMIDIFSGLKTKAIAQKLLVSEKKFIHIVPIFI